MSTKILVVLFFIILFGMIGGIVYMYTTPKNPGQTVQSNSMDNVSSPQANTQADPSTQDVTVDSQSIDDSMTALDTDLNTVDAGLNDQQTDLQSQL